MVSVQSFKDSVRESESASIVYLCLSSGHSRKWEARLSMKKIIFKNAYFSVRLLPVASLKPGV